LCCSRIENKLNTLTRFSLEGKVAVVTGGSRGIGRAITIALADAGAEVAVVARDQILLDQLATEVKAAGRDCLPISLDVSRDDAPQRIVDAVTQWKGRIDILCNNAGMVNRDPATQVSKTTWNDVIGLNLNSAFFIAQAVGREMIAAKKGKIINIGSLKSVQGDRNIVSYAASKGGLLQMTKALAVEWAAHNVQVNCIMPGYYITDLTKDLQADRERFGSILKRIPMGRWGEPEDLKGAAVFLASSASDYVTGIMLPVDGGYLAG
jgi:2-dehydro-3-deoxy-D-gluconate 5-dehydrogenase